MALLSWETRRVRVMGAKRAVVAAASVVIGVLAQAAWLATAGLLQAVAGDRGGLPTRSNAQAVLSKAGSERVVHIPEALTTLFSAHVATYGTRGTDAWLFGDDATRFNRNSAGHLWRGVRAAYGMDDFTLHDLRHFYASGLIAVGCDVVTVQRSLGHSAPSITLDTYSHLWSTAEDRTRAAAAGLMDAAFRDRNQSAELT